MSDGKYKVVSSASQFPPPPKPRRELVVLPELGLDSDGDALAVYQYELLTGVHNEFLISDQVRDENGNVIKVKHSPGRDVRMLAYTTCDGDGNRLWHTIEQAAEVLNSWGKSITNKMAAAAARVNYDEALSAEEAAERAEGNSETASTSS